MVIFDYRQPRPELREFVREYQIIQFQFPRFIDEFPVKPYWPRPEIVLSFFPKDLEGISYSKGIKPIKSCRSRFHGQHTQITFRQVDKDMLVFQVLFQPGGFFRITGIPSQLLTNTFIDAELVFHKETKVLNDRLSYTNNYQEMLPLIEEYLLELVKKIKKAAHPVDQIAKYLFSNLPAKNLDWFASQACLSPRHFYRLFTEREGISPKTYARISRFDKIIKTKNLHPNLDWLTLALEYEYSDYQHLSKDFKDFTELTPVQFFELENKAPERSFGIIEP
jgi:AraC-like DNA-binding protein